MSKAILVLLDGCGYDVATKYAGVLEQLVEKGRCAKYRLRGELPSMSRPMYETVMTGLDSTTHGIITNDFTKPSDHDNLFSMCVRAGKTTAAAAYGWMSELYNGERFHLPEGRIQLGRETGIQNGIFYCEDDYPDSHLFADAEFLRRTYHPDFLLIHPMNMDFTGHRFGCESGEHRGKVMGACETVAQRLPEWRADGYSVVVTADHGMDAQGMHGGTLDVHRDVPLYLFADGADNGDHAEPLSQLTVAPLMCRLLGLEKAEGMMDSKI